MNRMMIWAKDITLTFSNQYSKIKDIQSDSERELVIDLFRKDERVFELEKQIEDFTYANHLLKLERDQYKELLDEIKEALNKE